MLTVLWFFSFIDGPFVQWSVEQERKRSKLPLLCDEIYVMVDQQVMKGVSVRDSIDNSLRAWRWLGNQ